MGVQMRSVKQRAQSAYQDLFCDARCCAYFFISLFSWFVVCCTYFGLHRQCSFLLIEEYNLPVNKRVMIICGVEALAIIFAWILVRSSKIGRKGGLSVTLFFGCMSCIMILTTGKWKQYLIVDKLAALGSMELATNYCIRKFYKCICYFMVICSRIISY